MPRRRNISRISKSKTLIQSLNFSKKASKDFSFELTSSDKASFFLQRTSSGSKSSPSKAFLSHHFSIPLNFGCLHSSGNA
jgi:hypothetical protein